VLDSAERKIKLYVNIYIYIYIHTYIYIYICNKIMKEKLLYSFLMFGHLSVLNLSSYIYYYRVNISFYYIKDMKILLTVFKL